MLDAAFPHVVDLLSSLVAPLFDSNHQQHHNNVGIVNTTALNDTAAIPHIFIPTRTTFGFPSSSLLPLQYNTCGLVCNRSIASHFCEYPALSPPTAYTFFERCWSYMKTTDVFTATVDLEAYSTRLFITIIDTLQSVMMDDQTPSWMAILSVLAVLVVLCAAWATWSWYVMQQRHFQDDASSYSPFSLSQDTSSSHTYTQTSQQWQRTQSQQQQTSQQWQRTQSQQQQTSQKSAKNDDSQDQWTQVSGDPLRPFSTHNVPSDDMTWSSCFGSQASPYVRMPLSRFEKIPDSP